MCLVGHQGPTRRGERERTHPPSLPLDSTALYAIKAGQALARPVPLVSLFPLLLALISLSSLVSLRPSLSLYISLKLILLSPSNQTHNQPQRPATGAPFVAHASREEPGDAEMQGG